MTHAATGVAMARPGQYLTFLLAGEEYGIAILRVREIVECGAVTRVPGTPPFIRGVVNLRGTVLPVVDLSMKFGLGETALSRWTSVVIVDAEWEGVTTTLGLMTDAMSRVLDLGPGEIEPVPSFGVPIKLDYLLGMGRAEPRFVLLLDIDRVLSPEELMALPVEEPATDRGAAPGSEQAAAAGEESR